MKTQVRIKSVESWNPDETSEKRLKKLRNCLRSEKKQKILRYLQMNYRKRTQTRVYHL